MIETSLRASLSTLLILVAALAFTACNAAYAERKAGDPVMAVSSVEITGEGSEAFNKKLVGEMLKSEWFVIKDDGIKLTGTLEKKHNGSYSLGLTAIDRNGLSVSSQKDTDDFGGTASERLDILARLAVQDITEQLAAQVRKGQQPVVSTIGTVTSNNDEPARAGTDNKK